MTGCCKGDDAFKKYIVSNSDRIDPLMTAILSGFGMHKIDFIVFPVLILLTIVLIGALVFAMTYVMAGSIKKVSAYELISE